MYTHKSNNLLLTLLQVMFPHLEGGGDMFLSFQQALVLCTPVDQPLSLELAYQYTQGVAPTVSEILSKMPRITKLEYDDEDDREGHEVEHLEDVASLLMIKADGRVFGGYANEAWVMDSTTRGGPRSFLFSLSDDVKFPFHGRDGTRYCLSCDQSSMMFGSQGDLALHSNGTCSVDLDSCFGTGSLSKDQYSFTNGGTSVPVEAIELWIVR